MAVAFVFPGQGSQAVGMGKALANAFSAARAVFDEVDAALGERLSAVMWEGPAETLTLTENAQPALMAVSLAALRVMESEAGIDLARDARFVAGHSLGEYSALAAARALTITDTARLLRTRGLAMQKAVPVGAGAMAALLGLELDAAQEVAAEAAQGQVCQAANDNGGGQVVVSGDRDAVMRAIDIAKARGAKRAMMLPVSAPFHCALMRPAADAMAEALAKVTIRTPMPPLVANVVARAHIGSARDRATVGRAGDRHRALARIRRLYGGSRGNGFLRTRRRQGTQRPGQADRRRRHRDRGRHARRRQCLQTGPGRLKQKRIAPKGAQCSTSVA